MHLHALSVRSWLAARRLGDPSPRVRFSGQYLIQPFRVRCDFANTRFICHCLPHVHMYFASTNVHSFFCCVRRRVLYFFHAARMRVCVWSVFLPVVRICTLLSFLRIPRFDPDPHRPHCFNRPPTPRTLFSGSMSAAHVRIRPLLLPRRVI